jgi:hypothetical protein
MEQSTAAAPPVNGSKGSTGPSNAKSKKAKKKAAKAKANAASSTNDTPNAAGDGAGSEGSDSEDGGGEDWKSTASGEEPRTGSTGPVATSATTPPRSPAPAPVPTPAPAAKLAESINPFDDDEGPVGTVDERKVSAQTSPSKTTPVKIAGVAKAAAHSTAHSRRSSNPFDDEDGADVSAGEAAIAPVAADTLTNLTTTTPEGGDAGSRARRMPAEDILKYVVLMVRVASFSFRAPFFVFLS